MIKILKSNIWSQMSWWQKSLVSKILKGLPPLYLWPPILRTHGISLAPKQSNLIRLFHLSNLLKVYTDQKFWQPTRNQFWFRRPWIYDPPFRGRIVAYGRCLVRIRILSDYATFGYFSLSLGRVKVSLIKYWPQYCIRYFDQNLFLLFQTFPVNF